MNLDVHFLFMFEKFAVTFFLKSKLFDYLFFFVLSESTKLYQYA